VSDEKSAESLTRPIIGTIVFVALVPGTVIGWLPHEISGWRFAPPLFGLAVFRWVGALLFLVSLPVFVDFLVRFVKDGFGTPAPIAEPKRLVVTGAFQRVRNPGYVAVVGMLVGQGLFFGGWDLLGYAAGIALIFHLFVVLWEEPHLRAKFGEEYADYCRRVPRWLPWPGSGGSS